MDEYLQRAMWIVQNFSGGDTLAYKMNIFHYIASYTYSSSTIH